VVEGTSPPAKLGRKVRTGLLFSFFNNAIGRMGTVLVGILLARLLTPEDYGVFAAALVALNALYILYDLGVGAALVRWPGDIDEIAPTVTTLAIAGGALTYAACWLAAPWFAAMMNAPESSGVVRLLGVTVLIGGITAAPVAQLDRNFRQGRRMIGELVTFATSTVVTVSLAVAGKGPWSLAWGRVAGVVVGAVLFLSLCDKRHRPGWDKVKARELLAFGLPLTGTAILWFAMLNLDYVIIGRTLGPVELGFYLLAFNLASWPVNMFSVAVRRVAPAGFAKLLDEPDRLNAALVRFLSVLMAVILPLCVLVAILAPAIVDVVYGTRWAPSAAALRWLIVLGGVRVATELSNDFMVAIGRSRTTMWIQALWTAVLVPALLAGAHLGGIEGVAAAHAVIASLVVLPAMLIALARRGIRPRRLAAGLGRPVLAAVLTSAVALLAALRIEGAVVKLLVACVLALLLLGPVVGPVLLDAWRTPRPAGS
jgi:PST family polysaccharide transporter